MRTALRGLGELLLTAGLVLLLFVGYQLWWTNVEAARDTKRVTHTLDRSWAAPAAPDYAKPAARPHKLATGDAIGFIHIPRLGHDYRKPIVQGVGLDQLAEGVGHYPGTDLPGAVGNVALAGHRATHGEPFRYLNKVRVGDSVVLETKSTWLTYVVDRTQVVLPTYTAVLLPVPEKPSARPSKALLTLTTCTPRATSTHRLIVFAHLTSTQPKADGRPAALKG